MKTTISSILSMAVAAFVLTPASAPGADEAAKAVTLKGTATCAKCDLGTAEKCETVLQVKDGGKTVTYELSGKADKDWHKNICKGAKEVTMTGTVSEKDGRKTLDVTKIEMPEKAEKKE